MKKYDIFRKAKKALNSFIAQQKHLKLKQIPVQ